MVRVIVFTLTLLLAAQVAVAAPAREKVSSSQAEFTSAQREICADHYEFESKFIHQHQPGDKVLALSEWKQAGDQAGQDQRLSYEKVTDIFTSLREQTHVFITLDNGQTIQATEGHPFLTSEGWRDAILLKRGGKLLIKGDADASAGAEAAKDTINKAIYKPNQPVAGIEPAQSATESIVKASLGSDAIQGGNVNSDRYATILEIRQERQTIQVFNIEVANAHTFFVGEEGVLVHNCKRGIGVEFTRLIREATFSANKNCVYCGKTTIRTKTPHPDRHHTDHKKSVADGGTGQATNAQTTCQTCNLDKGRLSDDAYRAKKGL